MNGYLGYEEDRCGIWATVNRLVTLREITDVVNKGKRPSVCPAYACANSASLDVEARPLPGNGRLPPH